MKKPVHEDAPTNAIGISSTTHGTGHVDTYDTPFLNQWHKMKTRKIKTFKEVVNGKKKARTG